MLLTKVVPAIDEKWPAGDWLCTITIQQDNAGPHINNDNKEFCSFVEGLGLKIKLGRQPAQSPETNVLDLGLFQAIDCACKRIPATNFEELVEAVPAAFDMLPWKTINKCFITLMATLDKIIRRESKNNFSTPHVKKDWMEKVANYQIMTILALSIIGEGPRNFLVDKDVPIKTNNANIAIAAPPSY